MRHYLGDQVFWGLFRKFAYPDPAMESVTNGQQCRLATTDDYLRLAEQVTGKKLDWFFNLYLRQPALPRIRYFKKDTLLTLQWVTPNNLPFPLPIDVQVGSNRLSVDMGSGSGTVVVPTGSSYLIDPDNWILMAAAQLVSVPEESVPKDFAIAIYPNPFNPTTTLRLEIPRRMHLSGDLISISGQRIAQILDSWFEPGTHSVLINLADQSSGVYFVVVRGDQAVLTRKIVLLK
jgi:hypothetical protein